MTNLYFKSLTPLSVHLINLFNKYDNGEIADSSFVEEISDIYKKNQELILDSEKEYSEALRKRIGIKRMRILKTICNDSKNFKTEV